RWPALQARSTGSPAARSTRSPRPRSPGSPGRRGSEERTLGVATRPVRAGRARDEEIGAQGRPLAHEAMAPGGEREATCDQLGPYPLASHAIVEARIVQVA